MPAVHDAIHDSMGAPHKTVQTKRKRAFKIRCRMRPASDTHVSVPDYLDPRRKIKVPRQELREPLDDQFYALHLGGSPSPVPS